MLCASACQKILVALQKHGADDTYRLIEGTLLIEEEVHCRTYSELRDAVDNGCYICGHVFEDSEYPEKGDTHSDKHITLYRLYRGTGHGEFWISIISNLSYISGMNRREPGGRPFQFILEPYQNVSSLIANQDLSESTGSQSSWRQASKWLEKCVHEHQCCQGSANLRTPTRLIDVGVDQSSQVRLVDSTKERVSGRYVTLSHCWGAHRPTRLLRSNFEQFTREIPWTDLPLTFQEAITFTRFLRVRYIWIDSLCIIQDEDWLDDWAHEAGTMQDVYSGSLLNIAADSALDSTMGLFRDRNPRLQQMCAISVPKIISTLHSSRQYVLYNCESFEDQVNNSPLAKRAWYQQERLLAPRVLHFGSHQLFWECHQHAASEEFPTGFSKATGSWPEGFHWLKNFDWPSLSAEDILTVVWPRILKTYTAARLTMPGDKLIALSGVARKLHDTIDGEYIAGLWRVGLLRQLCWHTVMRDRQRPSLYRAPTFSWAFIDSAVFAPALCREDVIEYAEFVQANSIPVSEDRFGAVAEAFIVLKCALKPASLVQDRKGRWSTVMHTFPLDTMDELEDQRLTQTFLDVDYESTDVDVATLIGNKTFRGHELLGLLLRPHGPKGTFQRIGMFWQIEEDPEGVQSILAPSSDALNLPCEGYDSATGKHTIRIV